jgi:hypothetical protein
LFCNQPEEEAAIPEASTQLLEQWNSKGVNGSYQMETADVVLVSGIGVF